MDRLKKDTVAKKLMGRSDIFASVFNYYLYGGRQVIRSEDLSELSIEELIVGRNGADRGLRDLLKSAVLKKDSGAQYLFLGIENQSSIDPFMVLRIIHYDVLSYLRQLKSRGRKEKLIPTITIIFNCSGRPWKKKLSLYDILDIPEELREFFESYCGNHTIYMLDPYSMDEEELEKLERDLMLVTKG